MLNGENFALGVFLDGIQTFLAHNRGYHLETLMIPTVPWQPFKTNSVKKLNMKWNLCHTILFTIFTTAGSLYIFHLFI